MPAMVRACAGLLLSGMPKSVGGEAQNNEIIDSTAGQEQQQGATMTVMLASIRVL